MGQARTINIPDHHLNRLAQHLINVVPEYFKNPAKRIKRILSHEEAQKEAKETCPHGMSYFLLSCHQCDKYDYCNLLWEFKEKGCDLNETTLAET